MGDKASVLDSINKAGVPSGEKRYTQMDRSDLELQDLPFEDVRGLLESNPGADERMKVMEKFYTAADNNFTNAVRLLVDDMNREEAEERGLFVASSYGMAAASAKRGFSSVAMVSQAMMHLMICMTFMAWPAGSALDSKQAKLWIEQVGKQLAASDLQNNSYHSLKRKADTGDKVTAWASVVMTAATFLEGMEYVGPAFTVISHAMDQMVTMIEVDALRLEILVELALVFEILSPMTREEEDDKPFFQSSAGRLHKHMLLKAIQAACNVMTGRPNGCVDLVLACLCAKSDKQKCELALKHLRTAKTDFLLMALHDRRGLGSKTRDRIDMVLDGQMRFRDNGCGGGGSGGTFTVRERALDEAVPLPQETDSAKESLPDMHMLQEQYNYFADQLNKQFNTSILVQQLKDMPASVIHHHEHLKGMCDDQAEELKRIREAISCLEGLLSQRTPPPTPPPTSPPSAAVQAMPSPGAPVKPHIPDPPPARSSAANQPNVNDLQNDIQNMFGNHADELRRIHAAIAELKELLSQHALQQENQPRTSPRAPDKPHGSDPPVDTPHQDIQDMFGNHALELQRIHTAIVHLEELLSQPAPPPAIQPSRGAPEQPNSSDLLVVNIQQHIQGMFVNQAEELKRIYVAVENLAKLPQTDQTRCQCENVVKQLKALDVRPMLAADGPIQVKLESLRSDVVTKLEALDNSIKQMPECHCNQGTDADKDDSVQEQLHQLKIELTVMLENLERSISTVSREDFSHPGMDAILRFVEEVLPYIEVRNFKDLKLKPNSIKPKRPQSTRPASSKSTSKDVSSPGYLLLKGDPGPSVSFTKEQRFTPGTPITPVTAGTGLGRL